MSLSDIPAVVIGAAVALVIWSRGPAVRRLAGGAVVALVTALSLSLILYCCYVDPCDTATGWWRWVLGCSDDSSGAR